MGTASSYKGTVQKIKVKNAFLKCMFFSKQFSSPVKYL